MLRSGYRPKFDRRDYVHPSYGATAPTQFPQELNVDAGLWLPNQNNYNAPSGLDTIPPLPFGCTDYSQVDLYNDHTKALHSPMILENITHANTRGGIDIRESLNAALKLGWFDNYSQVRASGLTDMFDALRIALMSEQADYWGITVGSPFFPDWLEPSTLPVPTNFKQFSWHNYDLKGFKTINGVPYLICKMWTGDFKYMSRDICNTIFAISGSIAFIPSNTPHDGTTIDWTFVDWVVGFFSNLAEAVKSSVRSQNPQTPLTTVEPATPVIEAPRPPVGPVKVALADFCTQIRNFEGKPGDPNYRRNNPGNARCSRVGYAAMYGKVGCENGFAVFSTYDLGWHYLQNLVKQKIAAHPTWNIYQFFADPKEGWAPLSDGNDPMHYSMTVAANLGVNISYLIKNIA